MRITANDNALVFEVLHFASAADDAPVIWVAGPFYSEAEAIRHSIEAEAYARSRSLPWFPTETVLRVLD